MKKMNTQNGITLIALIITIVVLLILAVVAINAVTGDGIIQHAANAKTDYEKASDDEEAMLGNYLDVLNANTQSSTQKTWTKISDEPTLVIGSKVEHNTTGEVFYVMGGDTVGTEITDSTQKVILLAEHCIEEDENGDLKQNASAGTVSFSSTNYWSSETSYPADLNDTAKYQIPEGATSIITIAKSYGASLGATGRLMTVEEVEALGGSKSNNSVDGCPGFINSTVYWLGSADGHDYVWFVYGKEGSLGVDSFGNYFIYGVRPVVEILKSDIS